MVSKLVIREFLEDEAAEVLDMWHRSEATSSITDTVEDINRVVRCPTASALVAESDGGIIGSVIGSFDGWRGNIYRLAVLPEFRRQGVARRLVASIEGWLLGQGAKRVTAIVEKDHPWAIGFWDTAGYAPEPLDVRYVRNL